MKKFCILCLFVNEMYCIKFLQYEICFKTLCKLFEQLNSSHVVETDIDQKLEAADIGFLLFCHFFKCFRGLSRVKTYAIHTYSQCYWDPMISSMHNHILRIDKDSMLSKSVQFAVSSNSVFI